MEPDASAPDILNPFGDSPETFFVHAGNLFVWIPAAFAAVALLVYLWGAIEYFGSNLKESEKHSGRIKMSWGFNAFIILFFIWLVIHLLTDTFQGNKKAGHDPLFCVLI